VGQPYAFSFTEAFLAGHADVSLKSMHFEVGSILKAYERIRPLADALGVETPRPRLAGFSYPHLASLGAQVEFAEDGEPNVRPLVHDPGEIDRLKEPEDYLAAPLLRSRLALAEELGRRRPDADSRFIGHLLEGPITTAVLLMGQEFLMLPYDDPERAHRLLGFCTESALRYAHALDARFGGALLSGPGPRNIPDDFAGMLPPDLFPEFVMPYWDRLYEGLQASERNLHSELLREGHLPHLHSLRIAHYDPSADQYVTPELLAKECPCAFITRIQSWEMRDRTADELEERYRRIAACGPHLITFDMDAMDRLPKVRRLLEVARALA